MTMDQDDISRISAELTELVAEAEDLSAEVSAERGVALVAVEHASPGEVKVRMAAVRSAVARKQQEILLKQKELQSLLEAKMAEVRAVVGPLQKTVKRLEEGIWSVNLYLGRDEEIVQLAGGEPAGADTPITIRQMVLAMDEECAVAAETGGLDAKSIEEFDAWLVEDPAHLDQVCPEAKCVVAFVPRWRSDGRYRDPWEAEQMEKANRHTYFLIRNGERLYRMDTDFDAGKRLVPSATEFAELFRTRRWRPGADEEEYADIEPGTHSFERAVEASDLRKRHYLRVALVLQGLLDRTTVFHPLPAERIDLTGIDCYDAGRVVVVTNDERVLGDGHEPFSDWQKRLNAELRPGMRVICAFGDSWRRDEDWRRHHRVAPHNASLPQSDVIYTIEDRVAGGLKILYERIDEIWVEGYWDRSRWIPGGARKPEKRASCIVYPNDGEVLAYDLATVEEMERYLRSRTDRHNYISMFPTLKAATGMKKAESAQEAPFRQMLAGLLSARNAVSIEDAMESVDELVAWWKLANRHHRPLVGGEAENAKAVRMIVAEHKRRLDDAGRSSDASLVATLRATHPEALVVARKRSGEYVVLEPENEGNVFVAETAYSARGVAKDTLRWRLVGGRVARWTVLYASESFASWDVHASPTYHLSGPEIEAAGAQVVELGREERWGGRLVAVTASVSEDGPAKRMKLVSWYADPAKAVVNLDHLLTAGPTDVSLSHQDWHWHRGPGGTVVIKGAGGWGSRWDRDEAAPPWRGEGRVLFVDEVAEAEVLDAHRVVAEVLETHKRLWDIATHHVRGLEAQWLARAEADARARFLEDYLDPDLWEGHRKTLKIRYPYDGRSTENAIWSVVARLVEAGHVLDGLTVAEAVDRARALYGVEAVVPEGLAELRL